ncbi:MAG: DUF3267 domain-containing protein [Bacteroidota bacterium]
MEAYDIPDGSEDRTASVAAANAYALGFILPVLVLLVGGYGLLWGWSVLGDGFNALVTPLWRFLLIFAAGIVVHEALHGIAWRLAGAPAGTVSFGFQVKTLTPYAHCSAALPAHAYRTGAAAPGVVLGLVPALVGLAFGMGAVFWFGTFFTLAAGGDALILWLLRGVPSGRLVKDHPSKPGCLLLPVSTS